MQAAAIAAAGCAASLGWWAAQCRASTLASAWRRFRHGWLRDPTPWWLRTLLWLVAPAAKRIAPRIPATWLQALQARLRRAGVPADGTTEAAAWLLLPALLAMVVIAAGLVVQPGAPGAAALLPITALVAALTPWLWLRAASRRRELAVLRELPFHLDMLALALESGATLSLALKASLPRAPAGPLRDGLATLLREMQAGRLRVDAIEALQRATDYPAVAPFTAALLRAERSGAGLAQALRVQAEQRRHERFHRAESLAMQAPVRMLGPLVLCIFPGTFLVLAFVVYVRSSGP